MNNRLEYLLDEAFKKHHDTGILTQRFDPERTKNTARVTGRYSPVLAAVSAVVVLALVFVGISRMKTEPEPRVITSSIPSESASKPDSTPVDESSVQDTAPDPAPKQETYAELELHVNEIPVYTWDEIEKLTERGTIKYERFGRQKIDVEKYANELKNSKKEYNALQNKSFVYHMMLNSIDYYTRAKGEMTYAFNADEPFYYYFETDMEKGMSYESCSGSDRLINERYYSDNELVEINAVTGKISQTYTAAPVEWVISDNDRLVLNTDGEPVALHRNDLTNLGVSGNSCLSPWSYATKYLSDFDCWSITGIKTVLDRTAVTLVGTVGENTGSGTAAGVDNSGVTLAGTVGENTFDMTIDLYTGIMLGVNEYDEAGNKTGYACAVSLSVDDDFTVREYTEK